MKRRACALVLVVALTAAGAGAGQAFAPDLSPRPAPRAALHGADGWAPRPSRVPVYSGASVRPMPRPGMVPATAPRVSGGWGRAGLPPRARPLRAARPAVITQPSGGSPLAVLVSTRPEARPTPGYAAPIAAAPETRVIGREGRLCGDRDIRGVTLAPIPGAQPECGVERPVRVASVDGVTLSRPATVDCDTARALKTWVRDGVKPAVGRLGGGVASLRVVASYACRPRNGQPGGRISEHGRGKAVDVAAVTLRNGISLSVLNGWRDPVQKKLLKRMHAAACGPFGTVLGPEADKYHQDHFHLDTARHRSGPYCR